MYLSGILKWDKLLHLTEIDRKTRNENSQQILEILHGRAEIRNICSSDFTSERSEQVKYFFNTRREISYLQAAM